MDWVQDMTARWMRIMTAADGGGTPLDEAVRQIRAIADTPARKGRPGRLRRHAAAAEDASAVTVLCRQLIAGVLVSDMAIARLSVLEGQSREQILAELTANAPEQLREQQVRALQTELSESRALLKSREPASYSGLGARIEQLLRLAEQQAVELIEAARAEAARITASAGAPQAGPGLGSGQDDPTAPRSVEGQLGGPQA